MLQAALLQSMGRIFFAQMSEQKIKNLLKNNGAITVADFINEAMFNPLNGYYRTKNPLGKEGDFITAPEISQMFGELIAAYFFNFILNSAAKKIAFVEMGAGRGTLFYDILRTFKNLSAKINCEREIFSRLDFHIIEISESLQKTQKEKLRDCDFKISWHQDFQGFEQSLKNDEEIYFVANELFDCFPIHQFVNIKNSWHERMVAAVDDKLVFVDEPANALKHKMVQSLIDQGLQLEDGAVFEYSFAATNFMNQLCEALAKRGGIGLVVDYGYTQLPLKSTLQALKNHQFSNVLENVYECDITSLVNFPSLEKCARKQNLQSSLISQRQFLLALEIEKRAKILNDETAMKRLIDADQMGELFKCLIIWRE